MNADRCSQMQGRVLNKHLVTFLPTDLYIISYVVCFCSKTPCFTSAAPSALNSRPAALSHTPQGPV